MCINALHWMACFNAPWFYTAVWACSDCTSCESQIRHIKVLPPRKKTSLEDFRVRLKMTFYATEISKNIEFFYEENLDIILISNMGADQFSRLICVSVVRMQQSNCLATTYAHLKQCLIR